MTIARAAQQFGHDFTSPVSTSARRGSGSRAVDCDRGRSDRHGLEDTPARLRGV